MPSFAVAWCPGGRQMLKPHTARGRGSGASSAGAPSGGVPLGDPTPGVGRPAVLPGGAFPSTISTSATAEDAACKG